MNNKVFISGKVTGDVSYPFKFEAAGVTVESEAFFDRHGSPFLALRYCRFGFRAVNPIELTFLDIPMSLLPYWLCMAVCLWHLTGCGSVYFLRDWQESRGATIEHKWAKFLHKKMIYQ